jgi:Domain found in Dishevelled, Egl-10, and Pleckstrin (DEP)
MTSPTPATICIDIPPGIALNTVTAATNALDVKLVAVASRPFNTLNGDKNFELQRAAYHLTTPNSLVVLDLSRLKSYRMHILDLARAIESPGLRNRFFLTNVHGAVPTSDEKFARTLGFSHLVSDLDPRQIVGNINTFTSWICKTLELNSSALHRLPTYLKTVPLSSLKESPREMIQRLVGCSAETLLDEMLRSLNISDRLYRLKKYRQCFLGTEATAWFVKRYKLTEEQSVMLGNALQQLGLLYHVAHEQAFANEGYFYRLATSKTVDALPMQQVLHTLMIGKGVEIADRSYLGKTYTQCFIGSEAVDHLVNKWSIDRLDAWIALHRFEQLGLLEHVTQEHGFVDGSFFYRFK